MANILYLESPAGSGYSYAKTPRGAETSDTKQIHQIDQFLRRVEFSFFSFFFCVYFVAVSSFVFFFLKRSFILFACCSGWWITLSLYRIHFTLVEIHIPGRLFQELCNRFHLVFLTYHSLMPLW